jgi:hypothetical protein
MAKQIDGKEENGNCLLAVFPPYPFHALAPALERSEGMEKLKHRGAIITRTTSIARA